MSIRKPAVAGRFYPDNREETIRIIDELIKKESLKFRKELYGREVIGGIVPHAGYIYSGGIAAHFFEILRHSKYDYDTAVIVAPNHTGFGAEIGCDSSQFWETPIGNVEVDREFLEETGVEVSEMANKYEHSVEVMVPFLKYFLDYDIKIAPIVIKNQTLKNSMQVAASIRRAAKALGRKVILIASSDFSHYVEPLYGARVDSEAVEKILKKDSSAFIEKIQEKDISICGYGPIMTLIEYSKLLEVNSEFEILRKGSSGEVLPSNEVVDYFTIALLKCEK